MLLPRQASRQTCHKKLGMVTRTHAGGAAQVWGPSGKHQLSQGAESAVEGVKNQAQSTPSTAEALQNKSVLISCLLLVFQQLSGINAIVYFSSSVFAKVGGSSCGLLAGHGCWVAGLAARLHSGGRVSAAATEAVS